MLFKKYIHPVWYAATDYGTTAMAWAAFYLLRKVWLHEKITPALVVTDTNFWMGVLLIPLGWLSLYTITGSYLFIYKKSRLAEFTNTFVGCIIGSMVLFFLLLLDDRSEEH